MDGLLQSYPNRHVECHMMCVAFQAALFEAAARASPQDGDVYSALGVVYNLARQYDEAVQAFRCVRITQPPGGFGGAGLGPLLGKWRQRWQAVLPELPSLTPSPALPLPPVSRRQASP